MSQDQEPNLSTLMLSAGSGSREAFRALYARTRAPIFLRLMAEIDDEDVCTELLKEVYIKVWELGHLYHEGAGDPVFWISMIARDEALKAIKENPALRRRNASPPDPEVARDCPPQTGSTQDPAEILIQENVGLCLPEISASSSTVMRMSYRDGKNYSEIAAATDGSEAEVRIELTRTISRINDRLASCGIRVENEVGRRDGHRSR